MGNRVQRADYELKAIPLNSEWGYKVACEKFGSDLVDSFPRFSKGKRKGLLKGFLCFVKVSIGGWAQNFPSGATVLTPGIKDWKLAMVEQDGDPKCHSTVATWSQDFGVKSFQTPEQAISRYKTYGTQPQYG